MGVTVTTEKIAKKINGDFHLYSTYGWHPLGVKAAIANINYWIRYRDELLTHVAALSRLFEQRLNQMKFKGKPEISVKGLAIAVELGNKRYAKKIKEACFEKGLLIDEDEGMIEMFPALNMREEVAEKGLKILEECL